MNGKSIFARFPMNWHNFKTWGPSKYKDAVLPVFPITTIRRSRYSFIFIPYLERLYLYWNQHTSDSKVHVANMGPTCVLSAPGGPYVGPMNLAIRDRKYSCVVAAGSGSLADHQLGFCKDWKSVKYLQTPDSWPITKYWMLFTSIKTSFVNILC